MIEFATFLLGLTIGQHPVELAVSPPVKTVELRLDGRTVATLAAPPWHYELDFGDQLLPHWLAAVGFDDNGAFVTSVHQTVNYARAEQDATIVLDSDQPDQQRRGRVMWQISAERQPARLSLKLNGETIRIDADGSFTLPEHHRSAEVSVLEAEIYFPPIRWTSPSAPPARQQKFLSNQLTIRELREQDQRDFLEERLTIPEKTVYAQLVFGQLHGDGASTTLTALPVRSTDWPSGAKLAGWFESGGLPLEVFSLSEEGGELFIVRDPQARKSLKKALDEIAKASSRDGVALPQGVRPWHAVRLLSTFPTEEHEGALFTTIEASADEIADGLVSLLPLSISQPGRGKEEKHRPWDSVALAGLSASQTNEARVVVLILSGDGQDFSSLLPKQTITYLASLRVPLFIWQDTDGAEVTTVMGATSTTALAACGRFSATSNGRWTSSASCG